RASPRQRVPPRAKPPLDPLSAPKEGGHLRLVPRLKAARHAGGSQHLPNRYWLRPAFQRDRAEIAIIEVPRREPARLRADQHCSWLSQRLEARREVRRLADDRLFRRGFVDQYLAHNDRARRNANANL